MSNQFPKLYKRDSRGELREWSMEVSGDRYRTISGLVSGKKTISEWKVAYPKNSGKRNATTAEEQAVAEVEALYTKRRDGEYTDAPDQKRDTLFQKPMLATKWENRKDKIDYPVYVQPKLDGVRCIATRDALYSRTGKKIVSAPHILEILRETIFRRHPNLVLDGELYNHDLKNDFNKIISLVRKTKPTEADISECRQVIQYHVYDVMDSHLGARRQSMLGNYVDVIDQHDANFFTKSIVRVPNRLAQDVRVVDDLHAEYIGQGYEGSIIRQVDKPYENKRSNSLMKRKDFEDAEFRIVRIEEGQGNWSGYAKRVIFELEDGRECGSGLAGDQEFTRQVLAERDDYVNGHVTVQFFTRTPDGMPRFPIAKALYKGRRDV